MGLYAPFLSFSLALRIVYVLAALWACPRRDFTLRKFQIASTRPAFNPVEVIRIRRLERCIMVINGTRESESIFLELLEESLSVPESS